MGKKGPEPLEAAPDHPIPGKKIVFSYRFSGFSESPKGDPRHPKMSQKWLKHKKIDFVHHLASALYAKAKFCHI